MFYQMISGEPNLNKVLIETPKNVTINLPTSIKDNQVTELLTAMLDTNPENRWKISKLLGCAYLLGASQDAQNMPLDILKENKKQLDELKQEIKRVRQGVMQVQDDVLAMQTQLFTIKELTTTNMVEARTSNLVLAYQFIRISSNPTREAFTEQLSDNNLCFMLTEKGVYELTLLLARKPEINTEWQVTSIEGVYVLSVQNRNGSQKEGGVITPTALEIKEVVKSPNVIATKALFKLEAIPSTLTKEKSSGNDYLKITFAVVMKMNKVEEVVKVTHTLGVRIYRENKNFQATAIKNKITDLWNSVPPWVQALLKQTPLILTKCVLIFAIAP